MSLGEAEALHGAPLLLALKTGNESRLAPPGDARIWVGSVLGAIGTRQKVSDFAQNQFLRMSTRLRTFGDLFNPSRAGISEAVVRSEEHTSELQSLMRISYAVFCLKTKKKNQSIT